MEGELKREPEPEDDDDEDVDDDDVVVASSQRASRAARSPAPTDAAQTAAWREVAELATRLETRGLERVGRLPPTTFVSRGSGRIGGGGGGAPRGSGGSRRGGGSGGSGGSGSSTALTTTNDAADKEPVLDAGKPANPTAQLSHVFSLQRPIDANAREASFLTYQSVLPLETTQLAASGMRSNSVRASLVNKPKKTCGGGQQTTRNNLGDLAAAASSQAVSVAIALGAARRIALDAHGVKPDDPRATIALDTSLLVDDTRIRHASLNQKVFIVATSARLISHALPTRLSQHSFLESMKEFARGELETGMIRQRVPQQVDALRSICNAVVDNTEGTSVWAAWVLLVHMLSDARLRRLIRSSAITDMDAATAALFQSYARGEITRRARMPPEAPPPPPPQPPQPQQPPQPPQLQRAPSPPPPSSPLVTETGLSELDPYAEPPMDPDDAASLANARKLFGNALEDAGAVPKAENRVVVVANAQGAKAQDESVQRTEKRTLSLKRKRPPTSGTVPHTSTSHFLEYWQAALGSEYASILKTMITQSKSAASAAALDTLCGQTPEGMRVNFNPLLLDISSKNAIKSAEAISSLVVTSEPRVPKIIVWRARDAENHIQLHAGIIRSPNDASNSTLHACGVAPSHVLPLKGKRNHTVPIWSLAVRNTTPHDLTTTMLPGVTEGAKLRLNTLATACTHLYYNSQARFTSKRCRMARLRCPAGTGFPRCLRMSSRVRRGAPPMARWTRRSRALRVASS